MKLVMLDRSTLGSDCDLSAFEKYGDFVAYDITSAEDTIERIKDADIVFSNKVILGKKEMDAATKLKYIGIMATGTNNVDLKYAEEKGIKVTNVSGYSTKIVAQHTFALLFAVMEQLQYYDNYIKSGAYSENPLFTNLDRSFPEISGKTWGIIGLGEIGREVAKIATAFGCKVIYYSTTGQNNNADYERVDFDELLTNSDILTVHAPLTDATKNLMDEKAFDKMKKTAYFINVGRGPIVNEEALKNAIDMEKIAGAGIDVFEKEPLQKESPLMSISNKEKIIMTPHIAWASREARKKLVEKMLINLENYLA